MKVSPEERKRFGMISACATRRPDPVHLIDSTYVVEHSPSLFSVEASSLCWEPGYFPEVVNTSLGNGQPLRRMCLGEHAALYAQPGGCTVTVFND